MVHPTADILTALEVASSANYVLLQKEPLQSQITVLAYTMSAFQYCLSLPSNTHLLVAILLIKRL